MKAIEKIDILKKELKKAKDKDEKEKIKKELKNIRISNHITIYDYLKWKRGN